MADGEAGRTPGGGWVPVPDPTALTTEAVERASDVFRREISALRELHDKDLAAFRTLLDARLEALADSVARRFEWVAQASDEHATARDKAVNGLRDLVEGRLGAMDQATQLLAQDLRNVPTAVERDTVALRELMESKLHAMEQAAGLQNEASASFPAEVRTEISHLKLLHEERFSSIAQQFNERDIRTDQASRASKEALDAALQAAKELVNAQGEASSAAAVKSETSFAKQIDQIGTIISTLEKALDARITELKERVDRGEGSTSGSAGQRVDQRASIGTVIAAVATLVAVISFVLVILKK